MNKFKLIELAFKNSGNLLKKGVERVSINPSFIRYHDKEHYLYFLHIDYINGEKSIDLFKSAEEVLNKSINRG